MTWLALWLLGVGVADIVRSAPHRQARVLAVAVGASTVVGVGLLAGMTGPADVVVLALSVVPLVGWVVLSARSLERGGGHVWPLCVLVVTATTLVALSGWASPPGGVLADWMRWADLPMLASAPVGRVLLIVGVGLANLATGNIIVRLVLVSIGAIRPTDEDVGRAERDKPEEKLKGGRLLGPMERVFILGLGLAGQITAASIVVAAKGLIRFPELQSATAAGDTIEGKGIDEVTEYFLVGSFVSWLLALVSLALIG